VVKGEVRIEREESLAPYAVEDPLNGVYIAFEEGLA